MKDKKIAIAVMAFAIVLLLTIASTYAYFTATATTDTTAETVNVKTAELGITYAHGTKVNFTGSDNLHDDWTGYVPFSVTNTGTLDQTFQVMWDTITTNTIVGYANPETDAVCDTNECGDVRDDFVWTLYELPTAFNAANPETSIAAGQIMGESYLFGATPNSKIVPNLLVATGATKNYVLKIDFNYKEYKQDYQQGKQFTGTIKVDNVEMYTPLVTTGLASDWQVSAATNASGGYTLEAFTGDLEDSGSVRVINNYFNNSNTSKEYILYHLEQNNDNSMGANKNAYIVQIPSIVNGKTITELSEDLFNALSLPAGSEATAEKYTRIKEVIIPEGVKYINDGTFEDLGAFGLCLNLEKLVLPSTLIEIGDYALNYTGLYELKIPQNLVVLGDGLFNLGGDLGIASTLNVVYPANPSLTTIGMVVFRSRGLKGTLTIPSSVTTIGDSAFSYNPITSIVFEGNNVSSIGELAFEGTYLTGEVNIPLSVTNIGESAFNGCDLITSINFQGRASLNGITFGARWNQVSYNPTVEIPITCSESAAPNHACS